MNNTQYGNYVKFIRGTEASWAKLDNSLKNSDTLYFISNTGSTSGKLYLGTKLISNGALSSATSLEQLNDVLISEGIVDQSILIYNSTEQRWEDKSILDIFQAINEVFKGADEENDGVAGLVPAPKAGQQNLFLRGDGSWANPVSEVTATVEAIQTKISTLVGTDTDLSIREIASAEASSAVASVIAQAPEQFDTLKEIADWIQANQGAVDVAGLTTRVTNLEDVIYGVEAKPEEGIVGVTGLQTIVSSLQTRFDILDEAVELNTSDITAIKDSLRWQDLIEE